MKIREQEKIIDKQSKELTDIKTRPKQEEQEDNQVKA